LSIEMALKKYKIQICILDYTMISLTIDGLWKETMSFDFNKQWACFFLNLLSHVLNYLKSILTFFKVQSCTIVSFTCASFDKSMGDERVVPLVDWTGKANGSIKFGQVQGIMNLSLHLFQLLVL
jgi:hypothetical protein